MGILLITLALIILAFEVVMFIHVLRNGRLSTSQRILWAAGMLLFHPFIAIIYYFMYYKAA